MWIALVACGSDDQAARCREMGDGTLRTASVEVRVGSTVLADGGLTAGAAPSCAHPARGHFIAASQVMEELPAALRPTRVVIHHAPALPTGGRPIAQLEMHRPSGSLLATASAIPRAVWLHEVAHLRMLGVRPRAAVARRLFDALEEGIADYYAATTLGSPRLGPRALDRPPALVADDWAQLALRSFDPHRLGHKLAASLWASEPAGGALVEDLVDCMAGAAETPADARTSAAFGAWLAGCPTRSRGAIRSVVCSWLPRELAANHCE